MKRPANASQGAATRHAVVIGAGMAGMLAAAALCAHTDVTIIERDRLPEGPEPRKGLPQARHAHLLWSGGARAMESLLPGVTDAWLAAGARRIPLPTGLVTLQPQGGWMRRWPEMEFMISCSRDLLDSVVRSRLAEHPRVSFLPDTELLALEGDASRVTGVRVRTPEGTERVLASGLVVDASGRGSRATRWLDALGVAQAPLEEVDSGLGYASRLFRAPGGAEDHPVINVQPDASDPVPGQSATIVPVEGGRWLVTLSGTRGGQPSSSADRFESFARGVRHPLVGELISGAEPLSDVVVTRSTVNRRRFFEKVGSWPEGFVVLGDAVATYNPVYGHGMTVAAQGAMALRDHVVRDGIAARGLARQVQKAVARPVSVAWELATSNDIRYPGAVGEQPGPLQRLLGRYVDRLMVTAPGRPLVAKAFLSVITLSAPVTALVRPEIVLAVLRGPRLPRLVAPPLTDIERETARRTPDGSDALS
ncbi:FAD-dependent monooxygenase [Streptomyces sp. NPDC047022]|uniref:NAD(P)/FAD-dependent oxidoreductase n=1 Tax=Streptomyces sp. NPDC047022 TaxID=3155737 RepID=UPI00340A7C68